MENQSTERPAIVITKPELEGFMSGVGWMGLVMMLGALIIGLTPAGDLSRAAGFALVAALIGGLGFVCYFAMGKSRQHDQAVAWENRAKELEAENKQLKQQSGQGTEA